MSSKQWVTPRHIQRLLLPQQARPASDGFVRAVMSKDQDAALAQVCRLDYMGNSEFEGRYVADIISYMTEKRRQFTTQTQEIMIFQTGTSPDELGQLYIDVHFLAPRHIMPQLIGWVAGVDARGERGFTAEPTHFLESVAFTFQNVKDCTPTGSKMDGTTLKMFFQGSAPAWPPSRPLGWLNCDVGAAYFLDETMCKDFAELIGVRA